MGKRILWGLIGVLLGANLYGIRAQESTGPGAGAQSLVKRYAPEGIAVVPRRYYLTTSTHLGDATLTACGVGFHMAAFAEIFNTTSLQYDTALGHTLADSGMGPPNTEGWVRTGNGSAGAGGPGGANCQVWSSPGFSRGTDAGTTVAFGNTNWAMSSTQASPWIAGTTTCDIPLRVWCVEDY